MSTKKSPRKRQRLEVVYDAKSGHVVAARSLDIQVIGKDAPSSVSFYPGENQVKKAVDISAEQAAVDFPNLFATHKIQNGRLVLKKQGK